MQNAYGCVGSSRPDSFPPPPHNHHHADFIPLNNFDTIRSYGSAGDELENLPHFSRDFVQNISKPFPLTHPPPPSALRAAAPSPDPDLHKPWMDALANNLKDAYYEHNKIQNGWYWTPIDVLSLGS